MTFRRTEASYDASSERFSTLVLAPGQELFLFAEGAERVTMTASDAYRDLMSFSSNGAPASAEKRLRIVSRLVLDLFAEVEALRKALQDSSRYRSAYQKTALLTHDNSGPSDGWVKLLELFYGTSEQIGDQRTREAMMLSRLGLSDKEIQAHQDRAKNMEMFT